MSSCLIKCLALSYVAMPKEFATIALIMQGWNPKKKPFTPDLI